MFRTLWRFLKNKQPSEAEAAFSLRLLFMLVFMGQTLLVLLVSVLLLLVTEPQRVSHPLMSQVLVFFALGQLPLGLFMGVGSARVGGKGAALSGIIVMAVMLSSPAWFTLFAYLTGSSSTYLLVLLFTLFTAQFIGLAMAGLFARGATLPDPEPQAKVEREKRQKLREQRREQQREQQHREQQHRE